MHTVNTGQNTGGRRKTPSAPVWSVSPAYAGIPNDIEKKRISQTRADRAEGAERTLQGRSFNDGNRIWQIGMSVFVIDGVLANRYNKYVCYS